MLSIDLRVSVFPLGRYTRVLGRIGRDGRKIHISVRPRSSFYLSLIRSKENEKLFDIVEVRYIPCSI